jgi:hypothetical protein
MEIGIVTAKSHEMKSFKVFKVLKVRDELGRKGFNTQSSGSDEVTINLSMKAKKAFSPKRFSIQLSDTGDIKFITDHQIYEEHFDTYDATFTHEATAKEFPTYEVTYNPISGAYDAVVEFFSNVYNSIVGFFSRAYDSIVKFFSSAYTVVTEYIGLFIVIIIIVICFFAPSAVVKLLGFTIDGIRAGSWAAWIMACYLGQVPVKSVCAIFQSIGATKLVYSRLAILIIFAIGIYALYRFSVYRSKAV